MNAGVYHERRVQKIVKERIYGVVNIAFTRRSEPASLMRDMNYRVLQIDLNGRFRQMSQHREHRVRQKIANEKFSRRHDTELGECHGRRQKSTGRSNQEAVPKYARYWHKRVQK